MNRVESGPEIGHWIAGRLGSVFSPDLANAIGLVRDGQIVAGVIYENFNGASVVVHIAVEGALTRGFISAIFDYPYRICGVQKLIAPVAASNTRSARLVEHMGFTPEARLSDCHPDGDLILYTLKRTACRFLQGRFSIGKIKPQSSAAA